MNSATVFRFLILVIPAIWVVFRLLPAEYPRYGNLKNIAPQAQEYQSRQVEHARIGGSAERDKDTYDKFVSQETRFKEHYRSHYTTSGYDYNHYRLAYNYGFDIALDSHKSEDGLEQCRTSRTPKLG